LWQKLIKSANKYFKKYLTSGAWYFDVIDAFMPTNSFDMIDQKEGEGGLLFNASLPKYAYII
jgi:hypothetical protein